MRMRAILSNLPLLIRMYGDGRLEQGVEFCSQKACAAESERPEADFFRKLQARVGRRRGQTPAVGASARKGGSA